MTQAEFKRLIRASFRDHCSRSGGMGKATGSKPMKWRRRLRIPTAPGFMLTSIAKEGDLGNAGYWYRRAGRPPATGALELEWTYIVETLLESHS